MHNTQRLIFFSFFFSVKSKNFIGTQFWFVLLSFCHFGWVRKISLEMFWVFEGSNKFAFTEKVLLTFWHWHCVTATTTATLTTSGRGRGLLLLGSFCAGGITRITGSWCLITERCRGCCSHRHSYLGPSGGCWETGAWIIGYGLHWSVIGLEAAAMTNYSCCRNGQIVISFNFSQQGSGTIQGVLKKYDRKAIAIKWVWKLYKWKIF